MGKNHFKNNVKHELLGMEIRNGKEGIHSVVDNKGKSTGEAFVQFTSPEDTENALKKNREKISHRQVGILSYEQKQTNTIYLLNIFYSFI